ncbi:MAG: CoA pyrophosphatase [Deltaproteobacteria bacterium]|nr:CoA pyrophosphatase [Deltaproteobacteria bacterium]MBW2385739.1 CoA pyrophosphatase [Deltaproteobacteria bacterium]MBW2698619.1 CoA pyrophosphatase [Deltaproteobacteria bacterium]
MTTLCHIRDRLQAHRPERVGREHLAQASVAVVLRDAPSGPEIVFIERARRDGDPWSGQMAFPGGRMESGDPTSRAAAERETFEEVGVSLAGADHLGLLAELQGNPRFERSRLVVSAHIYHVTDPAPFVLEQREVHDALWFPLAELLDPERHVEYRSPRAANGSFPGIVVGEPDRQVVWGLTYHFVDLFLQAIDRPLPDRWQPVGEFRLRL